MVLYSEIAWQSALPIYNNITKHPFIRDVAHGNLSYSIFAQYIKQDEFYLQRYRDALEFLANNDMEHQSFFLKAQLDAASEHQQDSNDHRYNITSSLTELTGATIAYSDFISDNCEQVDYLANCVAAILPCYWVYREVGYLLQDIMVPNNQYENWIATYSNNAFNESVTEVIAIFDELAMRAGDDTSNAMVNIFYRGVAHEYNFWDDCYKN